MSNISFEESVRPVCLPAAKENVKIGTVLTVAGWGKTPFGKLNNNLFYILLSYHFYYLSYQPTTMTRNSRPLYEYYPVQSAIKRTKSQSSFSDLVNCVQEVPVDRTLVVAIAEMDFTKSVKAFTTFKESCLSEPVPVVTRSGRALALRYHGSLTGLKSMTQLIEPRPREGTEV